MARPNNEFLMAWSSLTSADTEPGWQAISLPSAGPLQLMAGRRSPDNAEAVLVGFPTARLAAADKDADGKLSFSEVVQARMAYFEAADGNQDDLLSLQECIAYERQRRRQPQ